MDALLRYLHPSIIATFTDLKIDQTTPENPSTPLELEYSKLMSLLVNKKEASAQFNVIKSLINDLSGVEFLSHKIYLLAHSVCLFPNTSVFIDNYIQDYFVEYYVMVNVINKNVVEVDGSSPECILMRSIKDGDVELAKESLSKIEYDHFSSRLKEEFVASANEMISKIERRLYNSQGVKNSQLEARLKDLSDRSERLIFAE